MVALTTPAFDKNFIAQDFNLIATDNKFYNLDKLKGPNGLLVMFICNHCPYVKSILDHIISDAKELKEFGINSVAIMSNEPIYEEDSFENMQKQELDFPYLLDETQEVAKNYDAVCTPDFFGFNKDLSLQYRGRLRSPNSDKELVEAMKLIASANIGPKEQYSSIGCSIKFKD